MESLPDPVLFVGGVARSGTTLLRNMLAAHPLIAVPDESPFIRDVYRELVRRGAPDDVALAWRLIREERFFKQWGLDPAHAEPALAAWRPRSYADLIRALFAAYAQQEGKPLSADKTPSHAYCFDWYGERFPASRFVHVLRDPREVCMSLSVQPWQPGGIEASAEKWASTVRRARKAQLMFPERFIEIRYEDLVATPIDELTKLCAFAGLPFAEEMLNYPATVGLLPDRHHTMSRAAPCSGLRCWHDELDAEDVAMIELIAGPTMKGVGYEPIADRVQLRIRIRRRRARATRRSRERISRWGETRQPARS